MRKPSSAISAEKQENNRMGKTRDLFKKIRDIKGTLHAKMSSIKDRNGMDITVAEDNKKRWQEYTEELDKKDLHDPDNHNGVINHLEPDILEYEVKWALGSKILKEMGISGHLTCLLRNLYAGQEATVRTGNGTTDWFQIGKGVHCN